MTERFDLEKAIKITGLNIHAENADEGKDFDIACRMIVNAIEEIQAYRAIGTVEEIQLTFELCKGLDCMVKMYEAIGTIDEFKALKNKSIPVIHGKAELELHDKEIRAKAIDELVHNAEVKIYEKISQNQSRMEFATGLSVASRIFDEVAEQLKGGAK